MNKKELDEVLKIMNEPITVNSIDYKYFTQEQYDNLIRVYDNAKWLVDYALTQSRFIDVLNERIDKAIEFIEHKEYGDEYANFVVPIGEDNGCPEWACEKLLEILKGKE